MALPKKLKKMSMKQYEKSGYDVEKPGIKEGSKADLADDKKRLAKINKQRKGK